MKLIRKKYHPKNYIYIKYKQCWFHSSYFTSPYLLVDIILENEDFDAVNLILIFLYQNEKLCELSMLISQPPGSLVYETQEARMN